MKNTLTFQDSSVPAIHVAPSDCLCVGVALSHLSIAMTVALAVLAKSFDEYRGVQHLFHLDDHGTVYLFKSIEPGKFERVQGFIVRGNSDASTHQTMFKESLRTYATEAGFLENYETAEREVMEPYVRSARGVSGLLFDLIFGNKDNPLDKDKGMVADTPDQAKRAN